MGDSREPKCQDNNLNESSMKAEKFVSIVHCGVPRTENNTWQTVSVQYMFVRWPL